MTGYLKINNTNYSVNIKSKSESWKGTTKHTTTKQITVEDLTGSQTLLEDITFRVARETGSSSSSGYLKETMCSDIEIQHLITFHILSLKMIQHCKNLELQIMFL